MNQDIGTIKMDLNKAIIACLVMTALFCGSIDAKGEDLGKDLIVYSEVPGGEASDQYSFAIRKVGSNGPWHRPFAFITKCKKGIEGKNHYFAHLSNWSNTYINFEMNGPVEIAIRKVNGKPIRQASVHPKKKATSCTVRDGYAYVVIEKPCLIAVDIDGQMDDQNTGKGYRGPPIHTLTIFANPLIKNRPKLDDPNVRTVKPGDVAPSEGDWKTLYFLPGVHDIGVGFPVHANRNYYIPGNAVVHGTMSNHGRWNDGHNIRIFGYGVLSGSKLAHPRFASPKPTEVNLHDPIHIVGATNTSVEGITLADSAHHSLMLVSGYEPEAPTDMRWLKIFTWRANGDGINPFGNGLIEDCFIRTQDDSTYVNGRGIRRVTYWNDYNGSTFVLSALPNRKIVVEDCDVIYARAGWNNWSGGRLFNMRGEGKGPCGEGVVFRNIRVEDSRPTLQHFMIAMQGLKPYSDPGQRQRGAGNISGILFQDIEIAAPSVLGEPDVLWGSANAEILNLTFDNVTIGGKKITSLDHFKHNQHVRNMRFK
ncbi:MAG: endo-polygalacturonase [Mariniblastus sp.]